MTTRDEIARIMKEEGKVRGATMQTDAEYVKRHYGAEGLEKVKKLQQEWGFPIDYDKLKALDWYPIGLRFVSMLGVKEALNLSDEDVRKMGSEAPKYSFVVKLLMKFFLSTEKTFRNAPIYWQKHWSRGKMELGEFNEKNKRMLIWLTDFNIHPIYCRFGEGYYETISRFSLPTAKCRETKCPTKGDDRHEYLITWE